MLVRLALLISLACIPLISACTQTGGLPLEALPAGSVSQAGHYRLGAGDIVRVGVYLEPELTGDYPILSDGNIAYPLLGAVPASGRTVDELKTELARRLRGGLVNNPRMTVGLAGYRPFYILGEVARPGRFAYEPDLTLDGAVATAGGYNFRANQRQVILRHNGDGMARRLVRKPGERIVVEPGDIITIPRRYF